MSTTKTFGTFFLPGPTEVREEIMAAMLQPMIPHRGSEFEKLFERLQHGLRPIFKTERPVYVSSSSATGLMEGAIRCAPPGRILCLVNGAFSERFAHIASMCGRDVDRYDVAWGQVHAIPQLDERLSMRKYSAITVVHSETSTGALNDVRAISDCGHRHGIVCLIDSVSGLGGAELRFDEWKLDYVLTGSQKALALPPGLSFAVASTSFIDQANGTHGRGVYFDLVELDAYARRNQTPSTPALTLLYALEAQAKSIASEGLENRWIRHKAMATRTQEWITKISDETGKKLANIAPLGSQSPTVSAIKLPAEVPTDNFVSGVAKRGIVVGTGYGKLKNSTFRIGHMGDHTMESLERCLAACSSVLRS
ncbi:MAG TPA: alanine--glyoxylate aminotransferase family protein [Gemmatimonadaceae bacterium]|jgi:aspartate aminotransferase-like enzyme|nr:alanine--glyoxylate aminotransferase family protein [Gemmatimonadaceae bacterium]